MPARRHRQAGKRLKLCRGPHADIRHQARIRRKPPVGGVSCPGAPLFIERDAKGRHTLLVAFNSAINVDDVLLVSPFDNAVAVETHIAPLVKRNQPMLF